MTAERMITRNQLHACKFEHMASDCVSYREESPDPGCTQSKALICYNQNSQQVIPVVGAPMQARLHVVSVHSSIGTPHKPIVPTLAHSHCSHWGRSLMISIRVAVCLALLGCWGLEDVLP